MAVELQHQSYQMHSCPMRKNSTAYNYCGQRFAVRTPRFFAASFTTSALVPKKQPRSWFVFSIFLIRSNQNSGLLPSRSSTSLAPALICFFGLQRDFDVAEKLFRESRFYYRAAFSDPSARRNGCWDFASAFFCFSLSLQFFYVCFKLILLSPPLQI